MPILQIRRLRLREVFFFLFVQGHTKVKQQRQVHTATKPLLFEQYHTNSLQKLVPNPPEVILIPEEAWKSTPKLITSI